MTMSVKAGHNVDVAGSGISLGVTLYSFTNEWWTRRYDLEGLLREVSERGLGPGVEIVGFQSIRSFPDVDEAFVDEWKSLLEKYGLIATCMGANVDVALRPDRLLTTEENAEYLNQQIVTASRLGFPVIRYQIGAPPEVIEACLPTAEKYGIKLGLEVHAPDSPRTESVRRVIDFYDRVNSPLLGFIPDFSSTMRGNPEGYLNDLVRNGLPTEELSRLVNVWAADGDPSERLEGYLESARARGVGKDALRNVQGLFTTNGHAPIDVWADAGFAERIVHVHGKCYGFDENGDEPSIDYPGLARVFTQVGYHGWVSAEWEGHTFLGPDEADALSLVASQQLLLRRAIAAAQK